VLDTEDIQTNNDRLISAGTGYPEGERFTLQLIEILEASNRPAVEEHCQVGRDAVFASDTDTAKPSGLLLHYNYGAAAVKWWGHHTDILRSRDPPHPPLPPSPSPSPPPRPRQRRRLDLPPPPTPGPSTGIPPYLRPPATNVHDRTISIRKRHPSEISDEVSDVNKTKVWESWDEDDWMMFCRLNTKAARERRQVVEEESSSNIRTWAQEVSDYQSTEL
jgi:hypothetical protein